MSRSYDKISVLLWLYHTDLADEFYQWLSPLKDHIDLHLSLCKDNNNSKAIAQLSTLNPVTVNFYPNTGADIYSFIHDIFDVNNPYFIKLHSKKSGWGRYKHANWRHILIDSFIGSSDTLNNNHSLLKSYNGKYLCSAPFICENQEIFHEKKIKQLSSMMSLHQLKDKSKIFSAGNMFGGNTSFFQNTIRPYKTKLKNLLAREQGKVEEESGTYCHSLERIFGYMCQPDIVFTRGRTIKIRIVGQNIRQKNLHFSITKFNDIYCLEQPSIYGNIREFSENNLQVFWLNTDSLENYHFIGNNTYINTKHVT